MELLTGIVALIVVFGVLWLALWLLKMVTIILLISYFAYQIGVNDLSFMDAAYSIYHIVETIVRGYIIPNTTNTVVDIKDGIINSEFGKVGIVNVQESFKHISTAVNNK